MSNKVELFSDEYLSDYLDKKLNKIIENIKLNVDNENIEYFKSCLNEIKDDVLVLEHDLNYNLDLGNYSNGEYPRIEKGYILKQRFKFTGNQDLFYLRANKHRENNLCGLVDECEDEKYLYFEISVPFKSEQNESLLLILKKIESLKVDFNFFIELQKKDIEYFIEKNMQKIENKYISVEKENKFKNDIEKKLRK